MSTEKTLVDYLVDSTNLNVDTSRARRWIVERRVVVGGVIVDDPAFRIPSDKEVSIRVILDPTKEPA